MEFQFIFITKMRRAAGRVGTRVLVRSQKTLAAAALVGGLLATGGAQAAAQSALPALGTGSAVSAQDVGTGALAAPGEGAATSSGTVASHSMASRALACTTCHGKDGRSTQQGYFPRIAGKPAGYLFNQLVNFRDGRRSYPQMGYLLEHLTDDYLLEMAQYFAGLQLPYAAPPAPQATPAVLAQGQQLVLQGDAARRIPACVQCHGARMTGVAPAIPGLLGLPRDYLNSQLGAWQTGQRRAHAPDCMADVARQLTPQDVSAVSAWLAAQPVPADGAPAARLPGKLPADCGGLDVSESAPRVQ